MSVRETGITHYSDPIAGERSNHNWGVRYDWTDGILGVTQRDDNGAFKDRVLLSPTQVRALLAFIKEHS